MKTRQSFKSKFDSRNTETEKADNHEPKNLAAINSVRDIQ